MAQYPNRFDGVTVYGLPANPSIGTIAVDTADGNLKKYNGASWDAVGTGAVDPTGLNLDSFHAITFDSNVLADFTQTGMVLSTNNPIRGTKSALLIHQSAINQSFKKTVVMDRKFRSKNLTLSFQNRSSAHPSNLTVLVTDETNVATLLSAQVNTDRQAFIANTASSTTISAIPSSVINFLAVGQTITGVGIPSNTVINSINVSALTMVISNAATATATGVAINTSALSSLRSFSFDVPANCASVSYTVTALPEANLPETYIDDLSLGLTPGIVLTGTVQIPRKVGTKAWTPTFTGFGTVTGIECEFDEDGEYYNIRGKFVSGTPTPVEARVSLPNNATSGGTSLIPSIAVAGTYVRNSAGGVAASKGGMVLIEPNVGYITFGSFDTFGSTTTNALVKTQAASLNDQWSFTARIPIAGANATTNIAQSFSQAALVQNPDSAIRLNGISGMGSAGTKVVRFANIAQNIGSAIQYISDSVNGDRFVALIAGNYTISTTIQPSGATGDPAITLNASTLTTDPSSMSANERIAYQTATTGSSNNMSCSVYLNVGDIIRVQNSAVSHTGGQFEMTYTGSLKQVNPQLNQKITIPTHQLRFEGASTRGSTDTAIVKFDTQTITQGDAWDVVNTAANGTVVTMKKAGTLVATSSVRAGTADQQFRLSLNQTNLTTNPSDSETLSTSYHTTAGFTGSLSWSGQVKVGDKIRVYSSTPLTSSSISMLNLSLTETSIPLAISNIWQQNGAGFNPDNLLLQQFDTAVLGDFTQTGLNLVIANAINGAKTAQLIHQPSVNQSFKQVFQVSPKFRGKNLTLKHDIISTAQNGNITITVVDETNSVTLVNSSAIATGSQSVTATVTNTSNTLTSVSSSVINTLSVGAKVTGVNIPSNTYITALSAVNGTITLSQSATGSGTVVRVSALPSIQKVTFDVPASCGSLSYLFTALPETTLCETYIDGISVDVTSQVLSSTSITVPKNNNTDWVSYTPSLSITGSSDNVAYWRRIGDSIEVKGSFSGTSTSGTYFFIGLPNGYVLNTSKLSIPANTTSSGGSFIGSMFENTASSIYGEIPLVTCPGTNIDRVFAGRRSAQVSTPITPESQNNFFQSSTVFSYQFTVPIAGWSANETESKTIPLTTAQLVQQSDAIFRVSSPVRGSTNTAVYYFGAITESRGDLKASWTGDSSLGNALTILEDGFYAFSFSLSASAGVNFTTTGITKNSTTLTTSPDDHSAATLLAVARDTDTGSAIGKEASVSWAGPLVAGDVIRFMGSPSNTTMSTQSQATISRIGSIKQLNPSSDSKIVIPTHQLRFEGASSRGSVDTGVVKFDTQVITQGDAWDVLNTSANGTVVTLKKAGKLSVQTSLYSTGGGSDFYITKNDATFLVGGPPIANRMAQATTLSTTANSCSAEFDVAIGDKIRVRWGNTDAVSATSNGTFTLSLTETAIPANFSNVLPQWSQSDSSVRLNTVTGYGSNAIFRFANNDVNFGTAITYEDTAAGAKLTINEDGNYTISMVMQLSAVANFGISRNSSSLSTGIAGQSVSERLAMQVVAGANYTGSTSWSGFLSKGDIIRPHGDTTSIGATPAYSSFTISKVGKPNLTSVDVTPFVNMKTTDVEVITQNAVTNTFGSTDTCVHILSPDTYTNNGILQITTTAANGTTIRALKDCEFYISADITINAPAANTYALITKNSTSLTTGPSVGSSQVLSYVLNTANGYLFHLGADTKLVAGDVIRIQRNNASFGADLNKLSIIAKADNNATAAPTQQVSSDTMSFVFKSTAINPDTDPIGTFNTYTIAANSDTKVIGTSAPTQTVSDMNINGIRIYTRIRSVAAVTATPSIVDIFIGKNLNSYQVLGFASSGKVDGLQDFFTTDGGLSIGIKKTYNASTGILRLDAGSSDFNVATTWSFLSGTGNTATNAYFVFNASKSPSLVTIPNLAPRIATLSDVKTNGTAGGSSSATTQTRTLNTIDDPTGIVTSLASNQFTLPKGSYYIEAMAPSMRSGANRIRIRNITDSTTSILGESVYGETSIDGVVVAHLKGAISINSPKVFELQHFISTAQSTWGLGWQASSGENEVYSQVKITKIKD